MRLRRLLEENRDIILRIEFLQETRRGNLYILKAKVVLIDSSVFYIREIWKGKTLVAYSYYWFDATGKLLEGWDNAPHHREIDTFPHHKHTAEGVERLEDLDIHAFLKNIRKIILP